MSCGVQQQASKVILDWDSLSSFELTSVWYDVGSEKRVGMPEGTKPGMRQGGCSSGDIMHIEDSVGLW